MIQRYIDHAGITVWKELNSKNEIIKYFTILSNKKYESKDFLEIKQLIETYLFNSLNPKTKIK